MLDNKKIDTKIPIHIGIIMDGNRRWAKERNLPTYEGHFKGLEVVKKMSDWFFSAGVKIVSVFAFSTENWNRSQDEVNYLMKLFEKTLLEEEAIAIEKGFKIIISGRLEELPGTLPETCREITDKTRSGINGILNICLNYGGRAEIVDAVKKIIKNKIDYGQIHEGMIKKYLYHNDLPDIDMVVRTSGEQRLSGFQLWKAAYAELMFINKYWPDFEKVDVEMIIEEYSRRQRRFGN
jgi:undecaprenyl diphosphate synthase